jgi:hypothetical protein
MAAIIRLCLAHHEAAAPFEIYGGLRLPAYPRARWTLSSSAVDRSVLAEAGVGDPQAYLQAQREVLTQALQTATTPTERVAFEARLKHLEQQGFGVVPLFVGLWSP